MLGITAVAAAGDLIHHVAGVLVRVPPAERKIAGRTSWRRRHLVGDGLHQREEHRLGDPLGNFRRAAGHRTRVAGIKKGASYAGDRQRLEGASVDRNIREDVLHRQINGGQRCRQHGIHRPEAGRRRAVEIEMQRLTRFRDCERDAERFVDDAIGIDKGLGVVKPIGDGGNLGPHPASRTGANRRNGLLKGRTAIARQQFHQAGFAGRQRRRLRLDIADPLAGNADIRHDDRKNFAVHRAALEQLDRRNAQSLLLDLGGVG